MIGQDVPTLRAPMRAEPRRSSLGKQVAVRGMMSRRALPTPRDLAPVYTIRAAEGVDNRDDQCAMDHLASTGSRTGAASPVKRIAIALFDAVTWAWILWTLYQVARYGGAVLFDPSTTSRIMAVISGERIDSAIGLTYTGWCGALLVVVELVLVGTALWWSHGARVARRRASLVLLAGWTLLWLGNSIWMEQLSAGRHASRTSIVAVAAGLLLARAVLRWTRPPRGA